MWLRTKEAGTSHLDSSGLYVNVVEKTRGEGALGGGWNQSRDVKLITFPYQPMRAPRLAASLSLAGVGTDARLSCGAPDGGRGLLRRLWPVSCHSRSRRLGGGGGGVASKGQRGSCVSQWDHISPAIRSTSGPCHRRRLRALLAHDRFHAPWALQLCRGLLQTRRHRTSRIPSRVAANPSEQPDKRSEQGANAPNRA